MNWRMSRILVSRHSQPIPTGKLYIFSVVAEVDGSYMGSYTATRRHCMSKAAVTHTFRKLKTPSRCRECDSYVYFQGAECIEVIFLISQTKLSHSNGHDNENMVVNIWW